MVTQIYQIKSNEIEKLLNFKGFIENHNTKITFTENLKDGFIVFILNFNDGNERKQFYSDFKKLLNR
jgi:hypothetical protein